MDNNLKVITVINSFLKNNDLCSAIETYKESRLNGEISGSPFQIIANLHFSTDHHMYYLFLEKLLNTDEVDCIKKDMFNFVDGVRLLSFKDLYRQYMKDMVDKDLSTIFHKLFSNNYISACYAYFIQHPEDAGLLKQENRAGQTPITLYLSTKTTPLHEGDLEHFKYFMSLTGAYEGSNTHYKNAIANLAENYIFYPFIFEEEITDIREFYRIFKYNLLFISDFYQVNPFQVRADIEAVIKNKKWI